MSSTPTSPTFFQQTRKAFVAFGVAFIGSAASAIPGVFADGKVDLSEVAIVLAAAVAFGAAAFGATFGVTNAKGSLSA